MGHVERGTQRGTTQAGREVETKDGLRGREDHRVFGITEVSPHCYSSWRGLGTTQYIIRRAGVAGLSMMTTWWVREEEKAPKHRQRTRDAKEADKVELHLEES